ncbi:hypothetical protein QF037_010174 [Streptomyces canus]|uniref:hypothetical protein n=1 Tax=Streptomyces canus TaxID=58343 RepID=UPI002780E405|nr:hypothetical protein [Streptomyces canus]MDQ0605741.1 hypothetical protein [Streptomyces canus]
MNDPVRRGARAAARQLRDHYPGLPYEVEIELRQRPTNRPEQYSDPVAIASLIVAVATLAWTAYNDLKTRESAPPPDAVERNVVGVLDRTDGTINFLSPSDLERLIHVVVTETLNAALPPDSEDDENLTH